MIFACESDKYHYIYKIMNPDVMKRTFLIISAAFIAIYAHAFTLVGKVTDGAQIVPYTSVYVKETPQNGTISDLKGVFTLDDVKEGQTIVVSFIGYKTMDIKLKKAPKDTLRVKLVEQPILLQEASVNSKNKKLSHKKQMKLMIADVRRQMERDFPDSTNVLYNVNSDYGVYNSQEVVAIEDLGGDIVEMAGRGKDKKDIIQMRINWITRYRDAHTQRNYERLDSTLKKSTNAKLVHYADSSRWVHKFLWGSGIKSGFDRFSDHANRWDVEERDSVIVFTYTESRNYIGIVKGNLVLSFFLDPITYRVLKQSQQLQVDANIPFGYKLSKEQIQMLNTIVIGVQFDKYWVKRAHIDIKRNILYTSYPDDHYGVKEKNVITNIHIEDRRRKKPIDFKQTGSIKVNDAKFGVRPFTKAEEMACYPLTLKPKPE